MLKLRPFFKTDAQTVLSWLHDEVSFRKWSADNYDHYPIDAGDMNRKYEEASRQSRFIPVMAYDEEGLVGHFLLCFTDEASGAVRLCFVIVDDKRRGKGLGQEMVASAVKYARVELHANSIVLGVFDSNPAAVQCYKSVGFRELPGGRDYFMCGQKWHGFEMIYAGM